MGVWLWTSIWPSFHYNPIIFKYFWYYTGTADFYAESSICLQNGLELMCIICIQNIDFCHKQTLECSHILYFMYQNQIIITMVIHFCFLYTGTWEHKIQMPVTEVSFVKHVNKVRIWKRKCPPRIPYSFEKNMLMIMSYQKKITVLSNCEDLQVISETCWQVRPLWTHNCISSFMHLHILILNISTQHCNA